MESTLSLEIKGKCEVNIYEDGHYFYIRLENFSEEVTI